MLDLDFSPEQELLRTTVRDLLARHCPLSVVREMEDDPVGFPAELWRRLAELDLVGLLLPEAHGGSGMSLLEGVALYEELGRSIAPVPHFVSAVLAGGLVAAAGRPAQQAAWLPGLAAGEAVWSVAWLEPGGGYAPAGVRATARFSGDGFVLNGTKRHVPFAAAADHLVVLARTGEGPEDVSPFVVERASEGVTMRQQFSLASDTQYEVTFHDVAVGAEGRLGAPGTGWAAFTDVLCRGQVLLAAQAVGGARQALDLAVQYAKDRHQFDKPLGAFQAVAHYLADAVTGVDGAEQLVHEAAWAGATDRPIDRLAPMAKLFACQVFRDTTATAQQIFGGIGFTVEFDIQLYFRRAKQLQLSWGDDRSLKTAVAAAVLG